MMKKLAAHTFLLLATIILMAHAVLPHHHHFAQFCIEGSHCHHHEVPDPFDNDHKHDGESNANCILNQLIISTSHHDKQECKCEDHSNGPFLIHDWHAVELHDDLLPLPISKATEVEFPLVKPTYTLLLSSSSALRAPPVV